MGHAAAMNAAAANAAITNADADRIFCEELFDALRAATFDGVGITRDAYGAGESIALDIVERVARAAGARHRARRRGQPGRDVAGNRAGAALHRLRVASRLRAAGRQFRRRAPGVVAGLAILAGFARENVRPRRTIKLYGLRGEESAFFARAYIGSSALFGRLTTADLASPHAVTGRTLADCMRDVGADVDRIARGEPLLDPTTVAAWLELHIEQGPVLVARDLPIGIVTGIRGNIRHRVVECIGEAGHSGAVPRWLRRDAVFATAELITHLDRHWRTLLERGRDLVVTCGIVGTDPAEHAIARIPGTVRFSFEARSQNVETLEAFYDLFLSECEGISEERGVTFKLDRRIESAPATMDAAWIDRLRAAARDLGLPDETIPSGAGHDAAVFAAAGVPSAMMFVRNEHGSHNPQEAMTLTDFLAGVSIMRAVLAEAAR